MTTKPAGNSRPPLSCRTPTVLRPGQLPPQGNRALQRSATRDNGHDVVRRLLDWAITGCLLAGCSRGQEPTAPWSGNLLEIDIAGAQAGPIRWSAGTNDGGPRTSPWSAMRNWQIQGSEIDAIKAVLEHFDEAGAVRNGCTCTVGLAVLGSVNVVPSGTIAEFSISVRDGTLRAALTRPEPSPLAPCHQHPRHQSSTSDARPRYEP